MVLILTGLFEQDLMGALPAITLRASSGCWEERMSPSCPDAVEFREEQQQLGLE